MSKIILAVDFGERRMGLAVSDPSYIIARPYCTLDTLKDKNPIEAIKRIVKKEDVGLIIVGYPYHTNGSISEKARVVDDFIKKLKTKLSRIPIKRTDERYSSVEAKEILGKKKGKKISDKKAIDRIAAAVFLQDYLNEHQGIKL